MLPVVLIAIVPLESEVEPHVARMLSACTAAMHEARCVRADEAAGPELARARVRWTSPTAVDVEVTRAGQAVPARRSLRFAPEDEPLERWRAVGFTTALMANEQASEPRSPSEPATRSAELSAVALLGNGLSTTPRTGAALNLDLAPWSAPLAISAGGEYSVTAASHDELEGRWTGLAAGLGWLARLTPELGTTARVQALVQGRSVSVRRGKDADIASEWVLGGRLQLDMTWPAEQAWAGVVSFEGTLFDGPTVILREDRQVADLPSFAASIGVGLRVRL